MSKYIIPGILLLLTVAGMGSAAILFQWPSGEMKTTLMLSGMILSVFLLGWIVLTAAGDERKRKNGTENYK